MLVGSQNNFEIESNPKNSPQGTRKGNQGPKGGQFTNKTVGLWFQNQI